MVLYLLGMALSWILFTRMIGIHKALSFDEDPFINTLSCFMLSMFWPISTPFALSYWHISKNN